MRLLLALLLLAAAGPAHASGGGKKAEAEALAPYVDIAPTGLPVVVDRKVVNYVFVQVRLHVAPGQDTLALKGKEPWYRDAMVRAAHRTPFVRADDWTALDDVRLKAAVLAEARRISGAKAFTRAEIRNQAPRTRIGMRRPEPSPRLPSRPLH